MEHLGLVSSPKIILGLSPNPRNSIISTKQFLGLPNLLRKPGKIGRYAKPTSSISVISFFQGPKDTKNIGLQRQTERKIITIPEKDTYLVGKDCFANIASSSGKETSSVGVNSQLSVPPPSSQVGSPLFWIGIGVGLSALFSWAAGRAKKYAMEQAMKTFTQQMNPQNNPFGNAAFSPGSPFPFPPPAAPTSNSSRAPISMSSQQTVDVPASKVDDTPSTPVKNVEPEKEPKKYAFVDVSPEETLQKNFFESYTESSETESPNEPQSSQPVSENGTAWKQETGASEGPFTSKTNPLMSVEALEKMMEDPTVQQMVYPYLPEEMRNPTTFKWMLQNPQYRQQLQDMLNNMGGIPEWDNRMMDSLKNFDLSSPEIKQQFGLCQYFKVEGCGCQLSKVEGRLMQFSLSKIMANPDVAMAFQNPRVQAAIMECSQNPLSIAKYQNDKEVMDVFNKISELFPGVTGP